LKHKLSKLTGISRITVLEKNPPKQGLKLASISGFGIASLCFREKSTKTRIETICGTIKNKINRSFREKSTKTRIETQLTIISLRDFCFVLEKNPPKQGLKRGLRWNTQQQQRRFREKSTKTRIETPLLGSVRIPHQVCFREKSTKTRIETLYQKPRRRKDAPKVLEKNPPKQGLKHKNLLVAVSVFLVLEKNPPKQGLKQNHFIPKNIELLGFREKSTKTRIETPIRYSICHQPSKRFREKSTKTRIETRLNCIEPRCF